MTYNVFGGTLNFAKLNSTVLSFLHFAIVSPTLHYIKTIYSDITRLKLQIPL